ncbi:hypothetical protein SLS60_009978 [Paraconiothyrium brasiliense]|uniref:Uncharacterized protein n=1 Tax=Paraconiothyrium brasiliense TaxID=300254 RepID=A0ABR3QT93_9PLEO
MNLYQFLAQPKAKSNYRICALDFRLGLDEPIIRPGLDVNRLDEAIRDEEAGLPGGKKGARGMSGNQDKAFQGRILIIEDLSKEIVEVLGTLLNIDPLFFALHLHTTQRASSHHQTIDEATLPSRLLALILVDPPMSHVYMTNDVDRQMVTLQLRHFLGGYEDFMAPHQYFMKAEEDTEVPADKPGMFDDLQQYWKRERPACFNPDDPSIQSLAYYTLRIAAAEWVKYIGVMQQCLKQYEYNHDQLPALSLDKFDRDLRELQSWRRRTMVSQTKIKSVLRFLSPKHCAMEAPQRDLEYLSEDFEHIHDTIDTVGRRLESMLPVVMSFVQITDARRSFAETADISRLTVLALIFVPLTFVSSLFSMNTEYSPGSGDFWVYFTVAIPITGLVVLIARPPVALTRKALEWVKERRKEPIVRRHDRSKSESIAEEMSAYRY